MNALQAEMPEAKSERISATPSLNRGIANRKLSHWSEFIDLIRNEHKNSQGLIYRGQADAKWKVESRLDRLERKHPRTRNYEIRFGAPNPEYFNCPPLSREFQLSAFKEAARGRRGASPQGLSDDEWWALAQHHGLATPMLDWTYSPFVALFFAFEEERCVGADGELCVPEMRAVFHTGLDIYNHLKNKQDRPMAFVPDYDSNFRVVNQAGLFLKMPLGRDLEGIVSEHFAEVSDRLAKLGIPNVVLGKIEIPDKDRIDCLKLLNKMVLLPKSWRF